MFRKIFLCAVYAALSSHTINAAASSEADLQDIRAQIQQLESRLNQSPASGSSSTGTSFFNPAISLTLGGTYSSLKQDPAIPPTGFAMSANPGHEQGFNLGESELGISANIDSTYRGVATFALDPTGGAGVENAYVQSNALGHGMNLKFGRFFSGLGYLNSQHAHAWDFVDQPLVYATLWDNQLRDDGLQLKWLAPTDRYLEVGGEIGRGQGFPGTDTTRNGNGAGVIFAHIGDDIGLEQSWRAGLSVHRTKRENASSDHVPDLFDTPDGVSNNFNGDSQTTGVDFVWKYAPDGNTRVNSLKLQGEYFRRKEHGMLTYDTNGADETDSYTVTQSGWYLQGVHQFFPRWRVGLRYDRLDSSVAEVGSLNTGNVISDYNYQPARTSLMVDFSSSEFSRLRLQLARDKSRQNAADNQVFVQYIMSLGAHGAHQY